MDPYKETFETWDKVAKLYEEKFMHLDLYDDTYHLFCERVNNSTAAVLDIGCGPGNITKYLSAKMPGAKIHGTDISPNMIALAKNNNPQATFEVMDSREIDTLNERYDAIIAGFCLPYLSPADISKLIKDCASLLLTEGLIYLSFVEGPPERSGYTTGSSGDRTYFYYHELDSLSAYLTENNFATTDLLHKNYKRNDGTEEVHTIIIAKKT